MALSRFVFAMGLTAVAGTPAPPKLPNITAVQQEIERNLKNPRRASPCTSAACTKPSKKHERLLPSQAGIQWMDHGGYCGAWSIQRTALAKGAWISQQKVRDHTVPGGGNDEEILSTNIDLALANLKLKSEGFAYKELPTPQADAYRAWLKKKLAAGHGVVWMIMLQGGHFPSYPALAPYGQYSHVEPVVGILSDHPLTDEQWYGDDYIAHYTDADEHTYFRSMGSLPDNTSLSGNCKKGDYYGYPCVYDKYGFGWSIEDLDDPREGLPLSLAVQPWRSEPDTRLGEQPINLVGIVTASGLEEGAVYAIYRWDSVEAAFDYSKATLVKRFAAAGKSVAHVDEEPIPSDGVAYYRCVRESVDMHPHVAI
mmetsp:Transcript_96653/g.279014  ORF Transcript_96653/g.279014 Transcript_96653/m.279014 type:complete len:368 (-) Transcript_96653:59-1162(-)